MTFTWVYNLFSCGQVPTQRTWDRDFLPLRKQLGIRCMFVKAICKVISFGDSILNTNPWPWTKVKLNIRNPGEPKMLTITPKLNDIDFIETSLLRFSTSHIFHYHHLRSLHITWEEQQFYFKARKRLNKVTRRGTINQPSKVVSLLFGTVSIPPCHPVSVNQDWFSYLSIHIFFCNLSLRGGCCIAKPAVKTNAQLSESNF